MAMRSSTLLGTRTFVTWRGSTVVRTTSLSLRSMSDSSSVMPHRGGPGSQSACPHRGELANEHLGHITACSCRCPRAARTVIAPRKPSHPCIRPDARLRHPRLRRVLCPVYRGLRVSLTFFAASFVLRPAFLSLALRWVSLPSAFSLWLPVVAPAASLALPLASLAWCLILSS